MHPAALPNLRDTYSQALNVVIRKELRLYSSSLRKAAAAATASGPSEPDMGMAHKRVGCASADCCLVPELGQRQANYTAIASPVGGTLSNARDWASGSSALTVMSVKYAVHDGKTLACYIAISKMHTSILLRNCIKYSDITYGDNMHRDIH